MESFPMALTSPPKPRCAFRVAAIGHRWDQLDRRHAGLIRGHVRAILSRVSDIASEVTGRNGSPFDGRAAELTLLSGLAEGTDRLAADAVLHEHAWRLHAVSPFAVAQYETDFAEPESLEEFRRLWKAAHARTVLDGPAGEYDAYAPLSRVLVDFSDLLVVVWNGQRGRGPGGTAGSIEAARAADMPIIRIDPAHPEKAWLEDLLCEDDQGRSHGLDMLTKRLTALLAAPVPAGGMDASRRHHGDLRDLYFGETVPRSRLPKVYDRLVGLLQKRGDQNRSSLPGAPAPADPGDATRAQWRGRWTAMPAAVTDAALERFGEYHGWADQLATAYAARFRQTFTWVFMLAWVAVLAAFLGATGLERDWLHVPVIGVIEVGVLAAISRLVLRGRRERYHERWLDYRALAERLRHLATLWPMLRSTPLIRVPTSDSPHDPRESWVGWVLRCVARDAGLLQVNCSRGYADACRALLREAELAPQREFHTRTMKRSGRVQTALAGYAEFFFLGATVFALAHLVISGFGLTFGSEATDHALDLLLAGLCVTLPAVAASIHGFLGTGDFSGTSLRSAAIEPRLAQLDARLGRIEPVDTTEVGKLAVEATTLMESELSTWRTVAQTREIETP